MKLISSLALALTLPLAACGHDAAEEDADAEACEHLQGGPFQQLTAGATRDSSAPMIDDDHVAYQITQPGFVFFAPAEAGDYLFFFDADPAVEITDPDGEVVTAEETAAGSDRCDEVAARHRVELAVGTSFLELTGTGVVTIVVESAVHEGH